jgi:hypothetical protein
MSSSSSNDSYSASSPIPSPQELSHLITEPDSLHSIARKFASKPTSTAILRYYKFLSQSIAQLEEELERHQMEREVIYNHLFDNRSFQTRIRPIVNEYRQKQVLIRQRFHPYSRTSGSPSMPSANNSPSTNNPPSIENGIQGRVSIEIHDRYDNESPDSYYTTLDDTLGSKKHPIIVTDDEKEECEGCRGDHEFRSCARDTAGEEKRYTPRPHFLKVQGSRKSRQILSPAYK